MRSARDRSSADAAEEVIDPQREQSLARLEQVDALVEYAVSRGLDSQGRIVKKLVPLINQARQQPQQLTSEEKAEILTLYSQLNRITPECITGATLVDSRNKSRNPSVRRVTQLTWYLIFPLVILSGALDLWMADGPEPEGGWRAYAFSFQRYWLGLLTPFLWGALGSCVYLLKRFSDLAEDRTFDADRLQGWGTRITLGAVLGGAVQYLYDPTAFTDAGLALDANALGFLTGVGVRVVYGAIEKTIEALASAMNLDALRTARSEQVEVRRYLNEQLASLTETEEDAQKRAVLLDLLAQLKGATKGG